MEKLSSPPESTSSTLILDTDVLVNWLTKELETNSGKPLWQAPYHIIELIEDKKFKGSICLTTLLEMRFFLRRKKEYNEKRIEDTISKILSIFDLIIPDEISLLRANKLQSEYPLDPFDAIILSLTLTLIEPLMISRDNDLLKITKRFVRANTPEEFLLSLSTSS